MDDLELIKSVLAGNAGSFRGLVVKYQERVLRLCHSMVGPSQAEDAAQEIFLKVYDSLSQFKGESAFSTWIYRVASNHCLNLIAKRKREKTESLDALLERSGAEIPSPGGGQGTMKAVEGRQIVRSILALLTPEEGLILTLREMEGLSYKELSETLHVSVDTVKVRLFRARKSLMVIAKKVL